MSTKVGFYHLVLWPLEKALPALVGKAYASGLKVVIMAGSVERVAHLDTLLWTFEADSWLPHGTMRDLDADRQPVYLTDGEENPNAAPVLVLTDGVAPSELDAYERCLVLFDGKDDAALAQARQQWSAWRRQGHELIYYQQTEQGGWQEKTRTGPPPDGIIATD